MPVQRRKLPPPPPVRLRADVFPADLKVTNNSTSPATSVQLTKTRVIVTLTHVFVFQDAHSGPALLLSSPLVDYIPPTPTHRLSARERREHPELTVSTATTESQRTLQFARSGSCGCGSKLRSFDPTPYLLDPDNPTPLSPASGRSASPDPSSIPVASKADR